MSRSEIQSIAGLVLGGHQPNFFPWFGYFEKMAKVDAFVFSDDVQYTKQSYINRVEILLGKKSAYLTLPVKRGNDQRIADKYYTRDVATLRKITKTLEINFSGLPYFSDIRHIISEFELAYFRFETVADLNIHMIGHIADLLGILTPTYRGTLLRLDDFRSNERLIKRCRLLGANVYLCGQGADDYQDEKLFKQEDIELRRINYNVGLTLLGEAMKYSILFSIAKFGVMSMRNALLFPRV